VRLTIQAAIITKNLANMQTGLNFLLWIADDYHTIVFVYLTKVVSLSLQRV
jgi:ABC-type thiamine transport system substrate-binding protein